MYRSDLGTARLPTSYKLEQSCLFHNCCYGIISVFFCLFIYFCVRQICRPKPCLEVPLSVRRETHFRVNSNLLSARVSIFTFSAQKKGRNICPTPVEKSRQRSFVSWLQRLQVRPSFFVVEDSHDRPLTCLFLRHHSHLPWFVYSVQSTVKLLVQSKPRLHDRSSVKSYTPLLYEVSTPFIWHYSIKYKMSIFTLFICCFYT